MNNWKNGNTYTAILVAFWSYVVFFFSASLLSDGLNGTPESLLVRGIIIGAGVVLIVYLIERKKWEIKNKYDKDVIENLLWLCKQKDRFINASIQENIEHPTDNKLQHGNESQQREERQRQQPNKSD